MPVPIVTHNLTTLINMQRVMVFEIFKVQYTECKKTYKTVRPFKCMTTQKYAGATIFRFLILM